VRRIVTSETAGGMGARRGPPASALAFPGERTAIHPTAVLEEGVVLSAGVVIGRNVRIGRDTEIGPNTVIGRWRDLGAWLFDRRQRLDRVRADLGTMSASSPER